MAILTWLVAGVVAANGTWNGVAEAATGPLLKVGFAERDIAVQAANAVDGGRVIEPPWTCAVCPELH
jgi:hypothetical protein